MKNEYKLGHMLVNQAKALCDEGAILVPAVTDKYPVNNPVHQTALNLGSNCLLMERELLKGADARISVLKECAVAAQCQLQAIYIYVSHDSLGLTPTMTLT